MEPFVRIPRSTIQEPWFRQASANMKVSALAALLAAHWKPTPARDCGVDLLLQPGELLVSERTFADEIGLSREELRRALAGLVMLGWISARRASDKPGAATILKIAQWSRYIHAEDEEAKKKAEQKKRPKAESTPKRKLQIPGASTSQADAVEASPPNAGAYANGLPAREMPRAPKLMRKQSPPAQTPAETPAQTPAETPARGPMDSVAANDRAPAQTPAETPAQTPAETPARRRLLLPRGPMDAGSQAAPRARSTEPYRALQSLTSSFPSTEEEGSARCARPTDERKGSEGVSTIGAQAGGGSAMVERPRLRLAVGGWAND